MAVIEMKASKRRARARAKAKANEKPTTKKHTEIDFNCILTHYCSWVFRLYFPLYVISRLDNVSDVIDDSMPAPGRTLDGDELIDDV